MHLSTGVGKCINLLKAGEMHLQMIFLVETAYSTVISLVYFALRQCFTCYVSRRGNAGTHKFLWAALYFFSPQKSCNLWTVFIAQTGIGELVGKGAWNISYSYL